MRKARLFGSCVCWGAPPWLPALGAPETPSGGNVGAESTTPALQPGLGPVSQVWRGEVGTQVPAGDLFTGPTQQRQNTPGTLCSGLTGHVLRGPAPSSLPECTFPPDPCPGTLPRASEQTCWPPVPSTSHTSAGLAFARNVSSAAACPPQLLSFSFSGNSHRPTGSCKKTTEMSHTPSPGFPPVTNSTWVNSTE